MERRKGKVGLSDDNKDEALETSSVTLSGSVLQFVFLANVHGVSVGIDLIFSSWEEPTFPAKVVLHTYVHIHTRTQTQTHIHTYTQMKTYTMESTKRM